MSENKVSIKDRILSKVKNDSAEEILQKGGLIAGTAYGMKHHNMNMVKALTTTGLIGSGIGTVAGSTVIPSMRLKHLHKKELGDNPDKKDYAKVIGVNALPAVAGFGMMAKNHNKLEEEANKAVDFIKNIAHPNVEPGNIPPVSSEGFMNKAKGFAKKINPAEIKKVVRGITPKKLAVGAGMLAGGAAMELPNFFVSPESIVNKKKQERMTKSAFDIVDEAYEKTAGDKNRTTFWHDRVLSDLKSDVGAVAGGVAGAGIGALTKKPWGMAIGSGVGALAGGGITTAKRLKNLNNKAFGTNPDTKDYVKSIGTKTLGLGGLVPGVGWLNTPEAIVKAKKRDMVKSALEIIEEAYEKI